jgi:hypothetical protein
MIQIIYALIQATPKMDLYKLVPASQRKLPDSWDISNNSSETTYAQSYAKLCDEYEIDPVQPLIDWKLSKHAKTGQHTTLCEPKYLNRFYTLAVFYLGPLDKDYYGRHCQVSFKVAEKRIPFEPSSRASANSMTRCTQL